MSVYERPELLWESDESDPLFREPEPTSVRIEREEERFWRFAERPFDPRPGK